jgi:predicted NAD/FAD-binding protein
LHEVTFQHPQLDAAALAAQAELADLGRRQRTYYAGAHAGFGFHEDGMRAGTAAAARLTADDRTEWSPGRHAGGAVGPEQRSEGRSEDNDLQPTIDDHASAGDRRAGGDASEPP